MRSLRCLSRSHMFQSLPDNLKVSISVEQPLRIQMRSLALQVDKDSPLTNLKESTTSFLIQIEELIQQGFHPKIAESNFKSSKAATHSLGPKKTSSKVSSISQANPKSSTSNPQSTTQHLSRAILKTNCCYNRNMQWRRIVSCSSKRTSPNWPITIVPRFRGRTYT